MVEFYEQEEGILVASEGLSLYLHEARDSFYDPIRNERVTTLIARDAQIREQIMKTKIDTALGILRETGSIDFELWQPRISFSTAVLECLNLIWFEKRSNERI